MNTRPGAYEIPAYRLGLHFGRKTNKGGNNTVKKILAVLGVMVLALAPAAALAKEGGRGGHGGHGGHGGYGGNGGSSPAVSAPAVAGSTDAGSGGLDGLTTTEGEAYGKDREQVHADARACDPSGNITVISKQDGSFTYGGLEYQLPTFVQCMKDKGYALSSAGRNDLTNFGAR